VSLRKLSSSLEEEYMRKIERDMLRTLLA